MVGAFAIKHLSEHISNLQWRKEPCEFPKTERKPKHRARERLQHTSSRFIMVHGCTVQWSARFGFCTPEYSHTHNIYLSSASKYASLCLLTGMVLLWPSFRPIENLLQLPFQVNALLRQHLGLVVFVLVTCPVSFDLRGMFVRKAAATANQSSY